MARRLGDPVLADRLEVDAAALQEAFEEAFWCDEIGTYALALDGRKKPCRVRASNAGHVLFGGLANPERAARVARTLFDSTLFSGWGVRTLATTEAYFNPMSYHNGSVWPHDNALIALGLARYGMRREAARIFQGMFDASCYIDLRRLPELFCGFPRRRGRGPTSYPVACSPQAWAAAAPFALLQACLGLDFDAERRIVSFDRPTLPGFLDSVTLSNLQLGGGEVDVVLRRSDGEVALNVGSRKGDIRVAMTS
jgi:glycogen debranching enzyme